jgi:AcrR family transcriptional regulator
MTSPPETDRRQLRGRPRDPEVERRIIDSAVALYGRVGWAGFTFDRVAREAGVGKSTLYLRWPSKRELLIDALLEYTKPIAAVDTGSLRGDMARVLTKLLEMHLGPAGQVGLRAFVEAAAAPEVLERFNERVVRHHEKATSVMIRRAIERGELPPDVKSDILIESMFGAVYQHAFSTRPEQREAALRDIPNYVPRLVDFLLAGALNSTDSP